MVAGSKIFERHYFDGRIGKTDVREGVLVVGDPGGSGVSALEDPCSGKWWLHINTLFKIPVKENILNIYLV